MTETGRDKGQGFSVVVNLVRCPNAECETDVLVVSANHGQTYKANGVWRVNPDHKRPAGIGYFRFLPTTSKPLSDAVPASVQDDYREAYLIRELSPKAAATLARRALQGMVRDFWGVTKRTLAEELEAIKDKCDHELYEAMMALKSIGNIGAHPERDIAVIVDIEPGEADQLLELLHHLDQEWYVAREARKRRLRGVKELAQVKKDEAKAAKPASD